MAKNARNIPADLFPTVRREVKSTHWLEWAGAKVNEETGEVTPKPKPKKRCVMIASSFNRARAETQSMIESEDWSACKARHLLALFDLMHVKVYKVEAVMTGEERYTMVMRAGGLVKREFGGDFLKVIDYFRWLWTREIGQEKWRRENPGRGGSGLSMGLCLSGRMITEYRLAMSRQRR